MPEIFLKRKPGRKLFLLILLLVFLLLPHPAKKDSKLGNPLERYGNISEDNSSAARKWIFLGEEIAKNANFAPATAARFYSYIASVYSDVLEKTGSSEQANVATAEIIKGFSPASTNFATNLAGLSPEAKKILQEYKKRLLEDNFNLTWDQKTPGENYWYIRDGKLDSGAMAGGWKKWILPDNFDIEVPAPPLPGSSLNELENEIIKYAVAHRLEADLPTIYFWHGASGFEKGQANDNITPAGVWQNILFKEMGSELDEASYARAQKILGQSIADSFIYAWRVKYQYFSLRPSMQIEDLDLAVADPPFPGYISGHSTISATAATVLSGLFPQKRDLWKKQATDARNSRLVAGIHYNIDNEVGLRLGEKIGQEILRKVLPENKVPKDRPFAIPLVYRSEAFAKISLAFTIGLTARDLFFGQMETFFKDAVSPKAGSKFIEVATKAGVSNSSSFGRFYPETNPMTGGAAWGDYDNDGKLDLYVGSINPELSGTLYKNNGNGTFTDTTLISGIDHKGNSFGVSWADFNNDANLDLYISNYGDAGSLSAPGEANVLYRNNGDGTFKNVTKEARVGGNYHSAGHAWADYNKDGYLDLYVANYGVIIDGKVKSEANNLYRNNGDGTFTDVASFLGVTDVVKPFGWIFPNKPVEEELRSGFSYQPLWFDYDGDGWEDLFVATDFGASPLFKNNRGRGFVDVTKEAGLNIYGTGMGVAAGDFDNDLDLDLFVTNIEEDYLWRNNGDGTFTEIAEEMGVADKGHGWATNMFDYDNDGDLDIHVINGAEGPNWRNKGRRIPTSRDSLYQNEGGKFIEVARRVGLGESEVALSAAWGDYNNDGATDMYVVQTNNQNKLYKNKGNKNNWIKIHLKGTKSNKSGIGSRITVKTPDGVQMQEVLSNSSYLSQNSIWLTFGLGGASTVEEVAISWPSGRVQNLKNIQPNQVLTITEKISD